jgi:hypothetical protein
VGFALAVKFHAFNGREDTSEDLSFVFFISDENAAVSNEPS